MRRRATLFLGMVVTCIALAAGGSPVSGQGYPPGTAEVTTTVVEVTTTAPQVVKAPPAVIAGVAVTGANIAKMLAVALALVILGIVFVRSARGRADQA